MPQTQTFILRVLVEPPSSDGRIELRGSLTVLGEEEALPFKDGQALLALLQQFASHNPEKKVKTETGA